MQNMDRLGDFLDKQEKIAQELRRESEFNLKKKNDLIWRLLHFFNYPMLIPIKFDFMEKPEYFYLTKERIAQLQIQGIYGEEDAN